MRELTRREEKMRRRRRRRRRRKRRRRKMRRRRAWDLKDKNGKLWGGQKVILRETADVAASTPLTAAATL